MCCIPDISLKPRHPVTGLIVKMFSTFKFVAALGVFDMGSQTRNDPFMEGRGIKVVQY